MTSDAIRYCDVWALAQAQGSVQGELALQGLSRLAAELAIADGTLRYRLDGLIDERGRAAARFEVEGAVTVRCDRCGRPVEVPIHESGEFFFVADEREFARLPIDESPQEPLLGSRHFDVAALVEDQAILALPISPRHDRCLASVAAGNDVGGEARTHRPFVALAALKKPGR